MTEKQVHKYVLSNTRYCVCEFDLNFHVWIVCNLQVTASFLYI